MEKSEIGNIKAGNTEKIIKSYGEDESVTRYDGWLHFSFFYEDIIDFTILVYSIRKNDEKSIEKAIIGFCDTIVKKHPGKIFDKQKYEIIKIWENPPDWTPSESLFSNGLKLWRGLINFFSLDYDTSKVESSYKIELITYQGDETIGIDVLKEAFAKFAEIYAEEKHFTIP